MNPEFIAILKKLVTEQGKEVLFNPTKCKAFLADYTHGEFKNESRLLIQIIEAGVPKAIDVSDNLSQCKQLKIKVLQEEFFLAKKIAEDVIDTLVIILRKTDEQTILLLQNKTTSSNEINTQIPSTTVTEEHQAPFGPFIVFLVIAVFAIILGILFNFLV